MVYRFEPSGDGSVVAESLAEGLDPYLGLHYPASDVPEQARRLYLVNRLRCLADTDDPGVPVNGRDLDLSGLRLRCHAPVYKEYLRSMGARASLVASLVVDGVLWGLIIANHRSPRLPGGGDRAAGNLVATLLSGRLADAERTRRLTLAARVSNLEGRLRLAFDAGGDLQRALDLVATDAVDLVGASGLALHQTGCWLTAGATPDVSTLESLRTHLTPRLLDGHVVADDGRDATLKALRTPGGPCGILARTLGVAGEALLLWFRPEWQHEVAWAGDPADTAKQVRTAQDGGYELGPRASFARWVESVTGRSRPWRSIDREAAACCSTALIGPILRSEAVRQTALARDLQHERDLRQVQDNLNQLLERRNQDLQSLIYMISHDLRSPLVNLQGFSSELERSLGELSILLQRYGALLPPTARASIQSTLSIDLPESLTYITASTERMDRLLKGLLSISRLGQAAVHPQPITLAAVMQDILASRRFQIAEAGAEVHLGELPLVQADPVLIGQVLGNLVDNALKYRHAERPLHLRISGGIDGAWAWASVTDNGCGIRPEHLKRIFIPFQRGEGTHDIPGEGLGLAIARVIMAKCGGDITAASDLGRGSTFTFRLPTTL
jgi:light-regulated signal transduction histidine kinase (bacteriophytochrome)